VRRGTKWSEFVKEGDVVPVTGPSGEYLGDALIKEDPSVSSIRKMERSLLAFDNDPACRTPSQLFAALKESYGEDLSYDEDFTFVLFRFDKLDRPPRQLTTLCPY
jgi:hypothetical protein